LVCAAAASDRGNTVSIVGRSLPSVISLHNCRPAQSRGQVIIMHGHQWYSRYVGATVITARTRSVANDRAVNVSV
jgi:hypothetical protein